MWRSLIALMPLLMASPVSSAAENCPAALDFYKRPLAGGEPVRLCEAYRGRVVLVVNTASKCGYTPQYEGLEAIYRRYRDRGLVVLGFPSNDFGGQEPGDAQQILKFCKLTYGVEFPMFEKTHVARADADPFYQALAAATGVYPKWNFHKYLLDREGRVVASFASGVEPQSETLRDAIEQLL